MGIFVFPHMGKSTFHTMGKTIFRTMGKFTCHLQPVKLVVPDTVHPRSAPRVRTLYMVDRCNMALVFADDPKTDLWGKGSTVAINNCIKQGKPVFVITKHRPDKINNYHVLPTCLFGVVKGYFIIPKRAGVITRSHSLKKKEVA